MSSSELQLNCNTHTQTDKFQHPGQSLQPTDLILPKNVSRLRSTTTGKIVDVPIV